MSMRVFENARVTYRRTFVLASGEAGGVEGWTHGVYGCQTMVRRFPISESQQVNLQEKMDENIICTELLEIMASQILVINRTMARC